MNLPALREIGFHANRRLQGVQELDHDLITGTDALHAVTDPVTTPTGTRVPGLRLGQARAHALLAALLVFRLLPHGFANRDLRTATAQLRGLQPDQLSAGQMTYDLRRLRLHGLIERISHSHRDRLTDRACTTRCSSPASTTGSSRPASPSSPTPPRGAAHRREQLPQSDRRPGPRPRTGRLKGATRLQHPDLTQHRGSAAPSPLASSV